jgi:hypothetical protein
MSMRNDLVRQQIEKHISDPTIPIEQKIATSLQELGEFRGKLTSDDLAVIMKNILYRLVEQQRFVGVEVPITHNVSEMSVKIARREAHVVCEMHVHHPITAFIRFTYTLENDVKAKTGKRLRLKNNVLEVKEVTHPFDIGAKTALKLLGVRGIAMRELSDPNDVIRRTLPEQLEKQGFKGKLEGIMLELLEDNTLEVYVRAC